jgi:fructose-1,6-bisphosphatase/sedoheptulose 1,7-bisphosphatase-like protein
MNTSLTQRLAGFVSAALLTVAMLAGVNALAIGDAPAGVLAASSVQTQS